MSVLSATEQIGERIETALYVCETAPYRRLDLHDLVLPHWTISLVIEGDIVLTTGGRIYAARPGDVMIHPPGIPFDETNPGPGLHLWFACEARIHDPHPENLLDRYPLSPVVRLSGDRLSAYRDAFARLESLHRIGVLSGTERLRQSALLTELLASLIEAWEEAGAVSRPSGLATPVGRFAPVIAFLRQNLCERVTRADLARIAALHPTAFDRAFVRATGQTPVRLLTEMRLSEVRRRLETTDETLESIARAVGLTDATHLSRLFRARFGTAPGKWRDGVNRTKNGYLSPLSE
ncbi:MAG: helix-turn-helix domain-containing protein [Akkermansiaceae bacterium]|nr:helix-turn-helix domain-containing protein [Armatimonadota bacterium]